MLLSNRVLPCHRKCITPVQNIGLWYEARHRLRGNRSYLVSENEFTFIPLGTRHRLENPGCVPFEIIEVQSGSYLGEDDIMRFEDKGSIEVADV